MKAVKQVIVIRKDLRMRRGKVSQGAHASMQFLRRKMVDHIDCSQDYFIRDTDETDFSNAEVEWFTGHYRKVVLQVDSELELNNLRAAAEAAGVQAHIIVDSGLTEFQGRPTPTCPGSGP